MITVQQTIEIIKQNQPVEKITTVDLYNALNMVLAEDIFATIDSPPYTNSALDGFAVFWEDIKSTEINNPVQLHVIGESSAGHPFKGQLEKGETIRISTGAIVPEQLDTIVPIENCVFERKKVKILEANKKGYSIRHQGEEFKKGDKLLDAGIAIGSGQIALLAAMGIAKVKVYKKPQITIITTGSELVPFDHHVEDHQLRDSNTPMLTTAILEAGGEVINTVHVKDDANLTKLILESSIKNSDLIISSGGVSMGNHDHVRDMALKAGFTELLWKVKQKPGKPMFLAKKNETMLIALPGNPVSAYICFKHYVRPLIYSLYGKSYSWPTLKGLVTGDIVNKMDRTHLLRVKLEADNGEFIINPLDRQGSHMPSTIAHADGYIILQEGDRYTKGDEIEVYLF